MQSKNRSGALSETRFLLTKSLLGTAFGSVVNTHLRLTENVLVQASASSRFEPVTHHLLDDLGLGGVVDSYSLSCFLSALLLSLCPAKVLLSGLIRGARYTRRLKDEQSRLSKTCVTINALSVQ